MTRDEQHNPDQNENAARIIAEATAAHAAAVAGSVELQAAWADWSRALPKVDERTMSLLRAGFEAGWEAAAKRT